MFCKNCGAEMRDGRCANCGYIDNPQESIDNYANSYQGRGYSNNNQSTLEKSPTYTKYLVLSIIQLVCCCQITGIIALIFVLSGESAFRIGDFSKYEENAKGAKIAIIIGFILPVVVVIAYAIMMAIGIMGSFSTLNY